MELAPGERPVEAGALARAGASRRHDAVAAAAWALGLWLCWTAATYLLEGRVLTLTRPEDTGARILYSVVANLLIGTAGSVYVLRRLVRKGVLSPQRSGFPVPRRTLLAVGAAIVLGSAAYAAQGPPTLDPVVLVNVYAQVLAVSVAEVLVCWSVIGGTVEALSKPIRRRGTLVAALAAAALFGAYHFAHSPPFNTVGAVVLLSVVGLVTGAFFFVSRDVYGTIVFHNCLGTIGVLGALERSGGLGMYTDVRAPIIAAGALSLAALVMAHLVWLRTAGAPDRRRPGHDGDW